ncbi:MAG TPA: response regulator transcription factor [Candidatus Methylacidiphilales bacterium]|jgi:DNA-binding NarL/FixJ family response regulator|nr:response regulator transcription factor [Candidatus Methylacidiphilales bacterium]
MEVITKPKSGPKESKRRIFLVDDHPILRDGLRRLLEAESDLSVCGEAENARKAFDRIEATAPELAIVDISLPGPSGIELIKGLRARFSALRVLVLSMHDEALYAERALRAGAKGYVMKQAPTEYLLTAVRRVLKDEIYLSQHLSTQLLGAFVSQKNSPGPILKKLSDREFEIVRLIGKGFTTGETAKELGISSKTVESHRGNIRRKLSLRSGSELVRFALAHAEDRV